MPDLILPRLRAHLFMQLQMELLKRAGNTGNGMAIMLSLIMVMDMKHCMDTWCG